MMSNITPRGMRGWVVCSAVSIALAAVGVVKAQLVVDQELGTIGAGSHSIVGDTTGGPNNAQNYFLPDDGFYWGSERVYSFSIVQPLTYTLTVNSTTPAYPNTNLDYYLLDSLATETAGASNSVYASSLTSRDYLDGAAPLTGITVLLASGTYYLAIDSFAGTDPFDAGAVGQFDVTIDLGDRGAVEGEPTTLTDWGVIANQGQPLLLTSAESVFDTVMSVFDADGDLVDLNDDEDFDNGIRTSRLEFADGLDAGAYFVSISAFETGFGGANWSHIPPNDQSEFGSYMIGYTDGGASSIQNGEILAPSSGGVGDVHWYTFEIAGPAVLGGDFNGDSVVDAADYTLWRDNLGAATETAINGAGDGQNGVDIGDYNLWRQNFGATIGSLASKASAVPEPATLWLIAGGILLIGLQSFGARS